MKLTILGGGGARMPAFVRAVLASRAGTFDEICLFEPDQLRRDTICRLAAELAVVLGHPDVVRVSSDAAAAFTRADYVFSAIRVGGDGGRVIDEEVALRRGIVGQETTGPGGCAMALRTIPVVLSYCELLSSCSPEAVLINFTNPAGLITQAICAQGKVRAVGVCDTPGGTVEHLGELLARFEELQRFDHCFAAFDPGLVRRVGAIPTEYVYYFYDPRRYLDGVVRAGVSRGQDVLRLNEELLAGLARAFAHGGVHAAWSAYDLLMGVRRDTYMRTDMQGDSGQGEARTRREAAGAADIEAADVGGYEGLALRVIDGLAGRGARDVIVNTRNGASMSFLDPDDIVEIPARVDAGGLSPLAVPALPRSAQALVAQVKEYERGIVEAAISGDAGLAGVALSQHPLVPGITAARELIGEYRERHGQHLAYLR